MSMADHTVLIVAARAIGIACGYHLSRAGAAVTYLVVCKKALANRNRRSTAMATTKQRKLERGCPLLALRDLNRSHQGVKGSLTDGSNHGKRDKRRRSTGQRFETSFRPSRQCR